MIIIDLFYNLVVSRILITTTLVQAPSGKTPHIIHLFKVTTSLHITATDYQSIGDRPF